MREGTRLQITLVVLVLIFCLPMQSLSQTVNGSFRGTVRDASGGSVPEALVKVTSAATGISRQTLTDPSGNYVLSELPPGVYDFMVSYGGFATVESRV